MENKKRIYVMEDGYLVPKKESKQDLEEVECNMCGNIMSLLEDESNYACFNSECTSCYEEYEEESKQETIKIACVQCCGTGEIQKSTNRKQSNFECDLCNGRGHWNKIIEPKQETLRDKLESLVVQWHQRQEHYVDVAYKHVDDAHNNRKFTYKAIATRDCWKELLMLLNSHKDGK